MNRLLLIFSLYFACLNIATAKEKPQPFKISKTISLPGVQGKFDHMAFDTKGQRLFLAAKGNNSVEVIDVRKGKTLFSIKQVQAPQGVLYLAEKDMLLVCGGGDGTLKAFQGHTYQLKFTVHLGKEADNIRYSAVNHKIYVAYGNGSIAVIDCSSFKKLYDIPFHAHPEAFSINLNGNKMWVNVPDRNTIDIVDLKSQKIIHSWKTDNHADNYPMTLVEKAHKLIVASRINPVISVLNSETGKIIQTFPCDSDPDAMFYDVLLDRVLVSCGGGSLYVLNKISGNVSNPVKIATRKGSRTCLWVKEFNELFVALPAMEGQPAQIRMYQ